MTVNLENKEESCGQTKKRATENTLKPSFFITTYICHHRQNTAAKRGFSFLFTYLRQILPRYTISSVRLEDFPANPTSFADPNLCRLASDEASNAARMS